MSDHDPVVKLEEKPVSAFPAASVRLVLTSTVKVLLGESRLAGVMVADLLSGARLIDAAISPTPPSMSRNEEELMFTGEIASEN